MKTFTRSLELPVTREELFAWHERPGALERLLPPWEPVRVERRSGGLEVGAEVVMRMTRAGLPFRWRARHTAYAAGHLFRDEQVSGPFRTWIHDHSFVETARGARLTDSVEWEAPLEPLSSFVARPIVESTIARMFDFRHARTRADLARHVLPFATAGAAVGGAANDALGRGMKTFAVSGASGLVGRALCAFLTTGGHRVLKLVRGQPRSSDELAWDAVRGEIDPRIGEADVVVHLAGEPLLGRWTEAKKRRIEQSRVLHTELLARALARAPRRPAAFVSASAIGLYGSDRGDEELDEHASSGEGFLARVCRGWEDATSPARDAGIRTVNARLGVVLTGGGGALAPLVSLFGKGLGGKLGDGSAWFSWVSLDDAVYGLHRLALDARASGPVNVVSPNPVRNAELTETLARVLARPAFLPAPPFMLRLVFGEVARETILASQRVLPRALDRLGYRFEHASLEGALRFELGRGQEVEGHSASSTALGSVSEAAERVALPARSSRAQRSGP